MATKFTTETLTPPSTLPKQTLCKIRTSDGECVGFYLPDLEKLLDLKNIRQHLQSLPSNCSTKLSTHKGSFISAQGMLALIDKVKSKHSAAFKAWFLDVALDGKDPASFKSFEGRQQKKRLASDQEFDSPPQKRQKVRDFKFCDRVFVDADEVHGLVASCDDLCKKIINSPQVHDSQRNFLDERNKELIRIARHMQEHIPKVCLIGEPGCGKSVAANKIALVPKLGKTDEWGKLPLDNRDIQHKVTSLTCFNYHLVRSNSDDFTISAVTCPVEVYQERGGTHETLSLPSLKTTLQFGQSNVLRSVKSIPEVSEWTRFHLAYNTSVPADMMKAIEYIEIRGPWDMPEKFVLVDTMGVAESSSFQAALVKAEITSADMILMPKSTLITAESLKFLERQGVFNNTARLPVIGVISKADSELSAQEEEDRQMEMIMAAGDDADLLADYDPIMRLSLLGDIAARVMIIHPETMLTSVELRRNLFAKILDGVRVNDVRIIVRGACSILFAINVMATTDGKSSRVIERELGGYEEKLSSEFDPIIDNELQELVNKLEKYMQSYYSKISVDKQSRNATVEAMRNLCVKRTLALLRKIRGHGETLLKRYLQDLMKKLGAKRMAEHPLLDFSITQMDTIYSKSCLIPTHSSELSDMSVSSLISSWIKGRNVEPLGQLVQLIRNKVKSYKIPEMCQDTFRQVCQQITASLAKEISLPKGVIETTKSLVTEWRKILLEWYQNANYRLDMVAKKISRQSAENPLTGLFGNEHRTVMDSIIGEIYQKVATREPVFDGDILKVSNVKTTNKDNDVISFERDLKSRQVSMVTSPRVQGLLENIANKMRNYQGKGGLCLFVPSKSFDEHGCQVYQKRIDFECLEGDIDHLIVLVVEQSQLNMYRKHFQNVSQLCLPGKLEVIFSVVPDNSDIDIYFETIRLVATQFKIPYIIRVPDNVEAFYEFKLLVLRLRQCTPARALMWTQSFLIELETELWQKSFDIIRENEKLLMFAMKRMDLEDTASYIGSLTSLKALNLEKDQGKLEVSHLQKFVHLLQKKPHSTDGFPQDQVPALEDVTKELAQQLAILQSLVAISCKVAIDTYRHNFKKWPMYMGILPPRGRAIQGPVIYRTDALYSISFCPPDEFLNGKTIPTDLGEVRSKKGTTKTNRKSTLRTAKWIDYYKQREQHITKILRDSGFVQLQNYLFTWSPKTKFKKGQATDVMRRAAENDSDEPVNNAQMSLGNLVSLSSSFVTPAIQAFANLENTERELKLRNLSIQDNVGGGDCLVLALLDHLKAMSLYEGDCDELRDDICRFVEDNWALLSTYEQLAEHFDSEERAQRWAASHRTPRVWCSSEFAIVAAIMFGVDLEFFVLNAYGELLPQQFSPRDKKHDEEIQLAYVNNNHWVSVWPDVDEMITDDDSDLIEGDY